jgi:hypothetical protein
MINKNTEYHAGHSQERENKIKRIQLIPTNQGRTQINPHGIHGLLVGMAGI